MSKYFSKTTRHEKAREFLEVKQGVMTMMEYVAKFIELAHFSNDYVATDMAKVKKFEDGLKLSIRGKIVGFLLKDVDFMVRTAMAIEREIDDERTIQDTGAVTRGRRVSLLLARGRSRGLLLHEGFKDRVVAIRAKAIPGLLARQGR